MKLNVHKMRITKKQKHTYLDIQIHTCIYKIHKVKNKNCKSEN